MVFSRLAGPATGDATTGGLWHLHNAFFTVNNMALVVILTGFSVGGPRTTTLRPWHASLGLVSAAHPGRAAEAANVPAKVQAN